MSESFGSYGWSGEAVDFITAALEDMKVDIVDPGVKAHYVPDENGLDACRELGKKIAEKLPD